MMRLLKFTTALSLLTFFALSSSACGDDGYWDDEYTTNPDTLVAPAAPSEILIQKVTVHETDNKGCVWDGPTCTPFVSTGFELPDPYAVAALFFEDDSHQAPITSNVCDDTLTCTFPGFGFSLASPREHTWKNITELLINVYDKDTGVEDDLIGKLSVPKGALEKAYQETKTKGHSVLKAPLDTRVVSIQLRIK